MNKYTFLQFKSFPVVFPNSRHGGHLHADAGAAAELATNSSLLKVRIPTVVWGI